ncbi:MAG: diaminopimelate dehydrogenase [Porphyromonas sp.]|nr:diaminopimelate dehydrogenase [Porphyromonas sp.]
MKSNKIGIAIVGYGNIGRYALEAIKASSDCELRGVVRRNPNDIPDELKSYKVVSSLEQIPDVDVAIIASPTRLVEQEAIKALKLGISTVDSFDIHDQIVSLRRTLGEEAKKAGRVAITAAGWDPGSDSVVRVLMQAMVPHGVTYTNFGPGMSMGHSVAAKAIPGVKDALSMTIPLGTSVHRRMVYIELEEGYSLEQVSASIKADPYFAHDETHVMAVNSVPELKDVGHGVAMSRKGVSGSTHNQLLDFSMRINNPALTSQILVACARATQRLSSGCYTLPEIAPIDLLPGDREEWISKLV